MRKKQAARQHQHRERDQWVLEAHSNDRVLPRSGRKYLKDLDRELQRFMARVAGLEARAAYDEANDDPNLALEAEEIYREALILRAEIRECLAAGKASQDDLVEKINDSWDQLRGSLDELKAGLRPIRPARLPMPTANGSKAFEFASDDFEDAEEDGFEFDHSPATTDRRIHRPRGGPKR